MNTYRMGNAYNIKSEKTFHCIEVMIQGKWMPVIMDQGLAIYEDYNTCYQVFTKLLIEEKNKNKNKTQLNEKILNKSQTEIFLKEENEKLKKMIDMLNKKLKQTQIKSKEKDLSELGDIEANDN